MTLAEAVVVLFTACNSLRVIAYVPQIVRIGRDQSGAAAISYTTWGLFAVSHLSTMAYAIVIVEDWSMALVFGVNTAFCFAIIGLTAWKRMARTERTGESRISGPTRIRS